jgi:hypothetical protein
MMYNAKGTGSKAVPLPYFLGESVINFTTLQYFTEIFLPPEPCKKLQFPVKQKGLEHNLRWRFENAEHNLPTFLESDPDKECLRKLRHRLRLQLSPVSRKSQETMETIFSRASVPPNASGWCCRKAAPNPDLLLGLTTKTC